MKIKFLVPCQLCIVTGINNDEPEETLETFNAGDTIEFDLVDHPERLINGEFSEDKNLWNVQLFDGSMVYGLSREWFEIIEE